MKKLITILASTIFLLSNPGEFAKEKVPKTIPLEILNIGDNMPDYQKNKNLILSNKFLISEKKCPTWIYRYSTEGEDKFAMAYSNFSSKPFAVYEFVSNKLYLDVEKENGESGNDGKIDEITQNPLKIKISNYNPECEIESYGTFF